MKQWQPHSWQGYSPSQLPHYPNEKVYQDALEKLRQLAPLITLAKVKHLNTLLAKASLGEMFLLQGGNSLERFSDCHAQSIQDRIKILLHGSLILSNRLNKPVIKVGQIAGQYARSRRLTHETRDLTSLPNYFGDLVNRPGFNSQERACDVKFLSQAYRCSDWTLTFLRELGKQQFSDLYKPHFWQLDFLSHHAQRDEFVDIINTVSRTLIQTEVTENKAMAETLLLPVFTSHEVVHLPYESSLTRQEPLTGKWYNLSTHLPWLNVRQANIDNAHIEYMRGIYNPLAIKIGPELSTDALMRLIDTLNPENDPGRLTLVHALGCKDIQSKLPAFISAVKSAGKIVLWSCDPMQANTRKIKDEKKIRYFDDIAQELKYAFEIHAAYNSHLGGIHLEMTGESVTECIGGGALVRGNSHPAFMNPRLNYEQALELFLSV